MVPAVKTAPSFFFATVKTAHQENQDACHVEQAAAEHRHIIDRCSNDDGPDKRIDVRQQVVNWFGNSALGRAVQSAYAGEYVSLSHRSTLKM